MVPDGTNSISCLLNKIGCCGNDFFLFFKSVNNQLKQSHFKFSLCFFFGSEGTKPAPLRLFHQLEWVVRGERSHLMASPDTTGLLYLLHCDRLSSPPQEPFEEWRPSLILNCLQGIIGERWVLVYLYVSAFWTNGPISLDVYGYMCSWNYVNCFTQSHFSYFSCHFLSFKLTPCCNYYF